MVYLISYDLNQSGQNYKDLYETIKSASNGTWMHYLDSTWIIQSSRSADEISNILKPALDNNDSLLVFEVQNQYAGWLPEEAWDYLKKMF